MSGVEKFRGPDYLAGFEPDPEAMDRLKTVPSETAQRLVREANREWTGYHSTETYLAPLAQADGDIVLRFLNTPGSTWVWWRGRYGGKHQYARFGTLPHYQDHKVISRRNGHPDRLAEFIEYSRPIPVFWENVPDSVWEVMSERRPYKERDRS